MTTNAFTTVDYLEEGRSRYTEKFKNDPVYDAYMSLILKYLKETQDTFKDLMQLRSIDTAEGKQLDQIGMIVGQSRVLVDYDSIPYFGFDGAPDAGTFGDSANPATGGTFRSDFDPQGGTSSVDDTTYRFLLKARIVANNTNCTTQEIIDGVNYFLGTTTASVTEQDYAKITVQLPATATEMQRYFLNDIGGHGGIVPAAAGVGVTIRYTLPDTILLHFDGSDGGTTFTDSSDNAFTVLGEGTITTSTDESKFGTASLKNFDTGDLVIAHDAAFNLSDSDFTIEAWINVNNYTTYGPVASLRGAVNAWDFFGVTNTAPYTSHHSVFNFWDSGGTQHYVQSADPVPLNTWTHVAVIRHGADITVYVNGVGGTPFNIGTDSIISSPGDLYISSLGHPYEAYRMNGYMDEFRMTKWAVYTGDFTPPSSPY